jgi:hypothetical protein
VEVIIAAPPVITQQPVSPVGLKVGDPLSLTAEVSGGTPIYYQWVKDGVQGRWSVASSSSISLNIAKTAAASAGTYQLLVINQFATVASDPVTVTLAPAASSGAPTARVPSR